MFDFPRGLVSTQGSNSALLDIPHILMILMRLPSCNSTHTSVPSVCSPHCISECTGAQGASPVTHWRCSYPKVSILPSLTQHSPSTPLFTCFPSAFRLSCVSICLEFYYCLHLQPSFSSIPLFCFGCAPDLLPSSCLYLHKRLSLVSFPVLFRLQDNLPSWPFSADSNASLKHTSARLFWNEPSYHRNTSLLPLVLICILIIGQFQQTPVPKI